MNEILEILKHKWFSSRRWIELGLTLGLSQPTLDEIEANHQHDVSRCLQECLTKWLNRSDNVDSVGPPTWNSLASGLHKINEKTIAQNLQKIGQ